MKVKYWAWYKKKLNNTTESGQKCVILHRLSQNIHYNKGHTYIIE